jgi:hypothetical protein
MFGNMADRIPDRFSPRWKIAEDRLLSFASIVPVRSK